MLNAVTFGPAPLASQMYTRSLWTAAAQPSVVGQERGTLHAVVPSAARILSRLVKLPAMMSPSGVNARLSVVDSSTRSTERHTWLPVALSSAYRYEWFVLPAR